MIIYKIYYYLKMENKTNYKKYTIKEKLHILNLHITMIYQSMKLKDYMEYQEKHKEIGKIKKNI